VAAGADGVHVGQADEAVARLRERVGPELLIGVSTHSREQLAAALETDADYVCVGPVYATPTKPDYPAVGLELVRHAANVVERPWFAIGGVDGVNVTEVAAAGAPRVAVVRAIRDAAEPRVAAAGLRAALEETPNVE
jgi:thiamine-phosphate pyrophosphorylase